MDTITSTNNQRIKDLVKLHKRRAREREGRVVLEGVRLVEEGFAAGFVQELFVADTVADTVRGQALIKAAMTSGITVWHCEPRVLQKAGETAANPGVIAAATIPPWGDLKEPLAEHAFVLWADELSDPGNLGTMVRTAAAAGAVAVAVTAGSVDPWNSKVVRSSMGSVFRIPLLYRTRSQMLQLFHSLDFDIVVADIQDAELYHAVNLLGRTVITIGNEAAGVHHDTLQQARHRVTLPMLAGVESLNASVAASVLLYECRRQRDIHRFI